MFTLPLSFVAISQQPVFSIKKYTAKDGLPDSYVSTIYHDSYGYLWASTFYGFSRFDGQQFVNFSYGNGFPALSGAVALEDKLHRLWITTNRGLVMKDRNGFTLLPTNDSFKVRYIYEVRQMRNGDIWAMTNYGAYRYNNNKLEKVTLVKGWENKDCRQVIETPGGLYINYGYQLFKINYDRVAIPISPYKTNYPYYSELKIYNSVLYINTLHGLFKITGDTLAPIFQDNFRNESSYTFFMDSHKRMWAASEKLGILVSAPGNEITFSYKLPVRSHLTTCISEDKENNIWIANFEGLIKVSENKIFVFDSSNSHLISDIRRLIRHPSGSILAASSKNGLLEYQDNNFKPSGLYKNLFSNIPGDNVVDGYCFDESARLWTLTRAGQVYAREKAVYKVFTDSVAGFEDIAFNPFTNKVYLCGKKIMVGDFNGIKTFESVAGPSIQQPKLIRITANKNILVVTSDSRFYMIDQKQHARDITDLINFPRVAALIKIFNDPDGGFWIAFSGSGMKKFNWVTANEFKEVYSLSTANGLPNNVISGCAFDGLGRMWCTTLSGLTIVSFDKKEKKYFINSINNMEGIDISNWEETSLLNDTADIWLSSFHNVYRFDAHSYVFKNVPPPVNIEKVQLNFTDTDWSQITDSISNLLNIPANPVLSYDQNTLNIFYKGISFSDPGHIEYSYKLEGLHDTWQTSLNNSVSFVKLGPGRYTFFVKARKANSRWSEPAQFSFTISKPFWNTWWFQLLAIAVASGILILMFRLRLSAVTRKAALQNQLRDLEMKALKAQMNPHFIYNALNSIQALIMDENHQMAIKYVGKFSKLLRQVLEQSENSLITLEKELIAARLYVELETLRMNVNLDFNIRIEDDLLPEKEKLPPLLLQPYIENALWHGLSRKEGEKKLDIIIKDSDEWITCIIKDNGVGRKHAGTFHHSTHQSMGLNITAKRLEAFNNDDAIIPVTINDLQNDNNESLGTEVIIRIKRKEGL